MPKRTTPPLTQSDLSQFLSQGSDFAFEMAALEKLRSLGLDAEHAAAYVDPITNRIRTYDIRARWIHQRLSVRLAVECKNLRGTAPLLVHATPRLVTEAYHTLVLRYRIGGMAFQDEKNRAGVYGPSEVVGRQTDQPIKDDNGDFKSSDAATYEKWSQAVNGCFDLIQEMARSPVHKYPQAGAVVPILVVPEDTLWQVDYDASGAVTEPVRSVDRTTLILRHKWTVSATYSPLTYDLSHLEIVTLPALGARIKYLLGKEGLFTDTETLLLPRS